MKRVISTALAAMAFNAVLPATADPGEADLWIGLVGNVDGFLLDDDTGDLWMTGGCLKPLARAVHRDGAWVSQTAEMVSVGRMSALLDQTFRLETGTGAPQITVINPTRGGEQRFSQVREIDCQIESCARFATIPACEG